MERQGPEARGETRRMQDETERQAAPRRRRRRRRRPRIWPLLLVLLAATAGILLFLRKDRPARDGGAGRVTVWPFPADPARKDQAKDEISEALAVLAVKNPETEDYVRDYTGVQPSPETVDMSAELAEDGVPLLMQWDERWGYCRYGDGLIGYTGCGPTCLSMVLLGLTGDETFHPAYVASFAQDNGYCVPGNGTAWKLFSEGAAKLGLTAKELPLWEATMQSELAAGRPIICIMGKGDFTEGGHYIVLTGYENGEFTVLGPNRRENCHGWSYERLEGQIKNLWSYAAS